MSNSMGSIFVFFVTILIGVILVQSLADPLWENENAFVNSNDTIGVNRVAGLTFDDTVQYQLNATYIKDLNSVVTGNGTTLVKDVDWRWVNNDKENGKFEIMNSSTTQNWRGNNTEWDYNYGKLYVRGNSASRMLLSLVLIFFAVGIMGWAAVYIYINFIKGNF